ncbi:GNAT family N-acetyltransferase [Streptomyces sp. NPDC050732]|uniref:GNAT family N-acetyltransferase n=1 Tax=Streptomyces sp. NPDC050732 TaxID=3154632 RepID=UPI0034132D6E
MTALPSARHATVPAPTPPDGRARHLAVLRSRLAYTWNNSPHTGWRTARRLADATGRSVTATISHGPPGEPVIAYLGLPQGQANILQLLEHQRARLGAPAAKPQRRRERVSWQRLTTGSWPQADLMVVGADSNRIGRLPGTAAVTAPFRVHLVVDVPADDQELQRKISKRERWEFNRNQRAHRWRLEEDPSPEALAFFYWRMHRPTMQRRHGDRSRSESAEAAQHAILPHGTLLFVTTADGQRVAGVLCHWSADRRTLTTRLLGVLGGDERHYADGAFKAVYHLLLRWARERGVPQVDFFGTEAFISKGIFQWKRKFSPRVVLPPNHFADKQIRLYIRRDTPQVRDLLVANPLLCWENGPGGRQLVPTYFTDAQRPPRLDLSARCPGLPEPRLLDLDVLSRGCA